MDRTVSWPLLPDELTISTLFAIREEKKNAKRNGLCHFYKAASSADASCFSKTPPCPTLKKGRQPAKRLPENVRFTASLLRLATSNSSSECISQTTKNSGEILKQLDSQGIRFFISINIFGKSFGDIHKKTQLVVEDQVALMVHVITGPIGHLSDILELLPLDPGGPELPRIASN